MTETEQLLGRASSLIGFSVVALGFLINSFVSVNFYLNSHDNLDLFIKILYILSISCIALSVMFGFLVYSLSSSYVPNIDDSVSNSLFKNHITQRQFRWLRFSLLFLVTGFAVLPFIVSLLATKDLNISFICFFIFILIFRFFHWKARKQLDKDREESLDKAVELDTPGYL